jgi:hypothetical protein
MQVSLQYINGMRGQGNVAGFCEKYSETCLYCKEPKCFLLYEGHA